MELMISDTFVSNRGHGRKQEELSDPHCILQAEYALKITGGAIAPTQHSTGVRPAPQLPSLGLFLRPISHGEGLLLATPLQVRWALPQYFRNCVKKR